MTELLRSYVVVMVAATFGLSLAWIRRRRELGGSYSLDLSPVLIALAGLTMGIWSFQAVIFQYEHVGRALIWYESPVSAVASTFSVIWMTKQIYTSRSAALKVREAYRNAEDNLVRVYIRRTPQCFSLDGLVGIGFPGGPCASCPLGPNGTKVCKQLFQTPADSLTHVDQTP